ncbi:NAD(P)/FAD-dependent oxidoreductase [Arthrobacter pascens]|uniref:NAD(P)/FAD-dependent oxidoreductase n=1 Tax=Arthrobacter pascens TaxID=1677 RepID=UPI0027D8AABF|nr:FAD/NAD(P)-binding oxidoreductase [Arthrobacter pascens]
MSARSGALIVGASRAGLSAARALRKGGFDGRIRVVGAERNLPYDRTAVSKGLMSGSDTIDEIGLAFPGELDDLDLILGHTAVSLDVERRRVTLDDGTALGFEVLFIATGSAAVWPASIPHLQGVHTLRTADDSMALCADLSDAKRVVVVGGGFIGAEVAAGIKSADVDVTMIVAGTVPLERALGREFGEEWAGVHREHGIDVRCGEYVASLSAEFDRVSAVVLSDGTSIDADVVVLGIGARPVTDWLHGSGLTLTDGVVCDENLMAAPGIYAIGDVAKWPHPKFGQLLRVEHWTNAHEQGTAAARHYLGVGGPFENVPYVWTDQFGYRIQVYGKTTDADLIHRVPSANPSVPRIVLYGSGSRLMAALGVDDPRSLLPLRRLIAQPDSWEHALSLVGS